MDEMSDTPRIDREVYTISKTDIGFKAVGLRLAQELERELAAAQTEAAINMENFKVTNQAYVRMDALRIELEGELQAAQDRLAAAERQSSLRHKLLCMTHADTMELWETLQTASCAIDRIHDCVTGKPFASNDEVAFILNTAEKKTKDCLQKHRQAYSEEARSNPAGQANAALAAERGRG